MNKHKEILNVMKNNRFKANLFFVRDCYIYLSCFIVFVMLGIVLIPNFYFRVY